MRTGPSALFCLAFVMRFLPGHIGGRVGFCSAILAGIEEIEGLAQMLKLAFRQGQGSDKFLVRGSTQLVQIRVASFLQGLDGDGSL